MSCSATDLLRLTQFRMATDRSLLAVDGCVALSAGAVSNILPQRTSSFFSVS